MQRELRGRGCRQAQFARSAGWQSHGERDRVVVAIQRGERERAGNAMRAHIATVQGAYEVYAGSI